MGMEAHLSVFFIVWGLLLISPSAVLAGGEILEGRGEYIMEDNETLKEAQDVAYKEAMRSLAQQVVVHIQSSSQAQEAELTADDVELMADALLNVIDKRFQKTVLPDGKLQVVALVKADLDEEASERALQERLAARRAKAQYEAANATYGEHRERNKDLQGEYSEAVRQAAAAMLAEGDAFRKDGEQDKALECYEQVIKADPKMGKAYSRRGDIWREQGELGLARQDYEKAVSLDAQDAEAHYGLAVICDKQGQRQNAIEEYRLFVDCANIVEHDEAIAYALERLAALEG